MEVTKTPNRIHPLVAAASVSVILVSLAGVAAITGILPTSHGSAAPTATPAAALTASAQTQAAPLAGPAPAAGGASNLATASVPTPAVTESKLAADDTPAPAPAKPAKPATKHKTTAHHASSSAYPATPDYSQTTSAPQSAPAPVYSPPPAQVAQAPAPCYECGRVEAVHAVQSQAAPSGLGAIAGGVVGGLLGNQVGGGNGRTLATVAGAVGGGLAGHQIEKKTRTASTYEVRVRMEDGHVRTFPFNNQPPWSVGDRVKVVDGYLQARG